ncbi:hypothetical protein L7F22_020269 [Adiantum nelumboides]|nr:hypothetical protein [Adiantum nelumboides]
MMLDEIAGHEMHSFMDDYSGYNQLNIALEDRTKTTFVLEWGAFMYLVMPFGLSNAPTTFQRCMMEIFSKFLHKFLAIYVDDFTINSIEELHILFLEMVFQRCREKRICLNPFKSVFMVWKGQLLGHVSKNGIKMVADKVKCILEARALEVMEVPPVAKKPRVILKELEQPVPTGLVDKGNAIIVDETTEGQQHQ